MRNVCTFSSISETKQRNLSAFRLTIRKKKRKVIFYVNIHTGVPAIPGAPESPFGP